MTNPTDLLLLPEVAEICRTSVNSVREWIRAGKLRAIRPGRRVLVRRADLDVLLTVAAVTNPP